MQARTVASATPRSTRVEKKGRTVARGIFLAGLLLAMRVDASPSVPVFSGADSYINLGTPEILQIPANHPFTIEGWVWFESIQATVTLYAKNSFRGGHPYSYMLGFAGSGTKMAAYTGQYGTPSKTWLEVALPVPLQIRRWYHVAYSFDGTDLAFILDGALVGTQPYSYGNRTTFDDLVKIGGYTASADIDGQVCDFRVWDHARDALHINTWMRQRLTGREAGLLGYWPLNQDDHRYVADRTIHDSRGEVVHATWTTVTNLPVSTFSPVHPVTGGRRFTSTNILNIAAFQAPGGYTHYQIVEGKAAPTDDPLAWQVTSTVPATVQFTLPVNETNVILSAWLTNCTASVPLRRHRFEGFYTLVEPAPVVRTSLTREKIPGQPVVVYPSDLDIGSSGGEVDGVTLLVASRSLVCDTPGVDQTPDAPQVTLDATGTFPLRLILRNEAGNLAVSETVCEVTVTEYSGTNFWTGNGQSDDWHDAANWSAGVPMAGQDVVMDTAIPARINAASSPLHSFRLGSNQHLTFEGWDSTLEATNLVVQGSMFHLPQTVVGPETNGLWQPQHRILLKGSNLTVQANATVNADYCGYLPRSGPGRSYLIGSFSTGGGGGNGGSGSSGYDGGEPGPECGSPSDPGHPGSGGGAGGDYGNNARPGGGAIHIDMQGVVAIHGTLTASGYSSLSTRGSSGSGGSIAIHCRTFTGSATGLIRADGGRGQGYAGCGGGGRIALHYDSAAQADVTPPAVRFSTFAWPFSSGITYTYSVQAQMGTLYLTDTALLADAPEGDVILDRQRFWHTRLHIGSRPASWSPASLIVSNCVVGFPRGYELNVAGDLTLGADTSAANPLRGDMEGALHCYTRNTNTLYGAHLNVARDLVIGAGGWLHPHTEGYSPAIVKIRVGRHASVDASGGIDARGQGYVSQAGNKNGHGAGTGWDMGGSYGGLGRGAPEAKRYGRADLPLDPGSPGHWTGRGSFTTSGSGGGAIHLLAGGRMRIDGLLTVEGANSFYYRGSGGSGGSIFLAGIRITGTGTLNARGGDASPYQNRAPGGGGRVAVWHHLSLEDVERRIAAGDSSGLVGRKEGGSFKGLVDVGVYPHDPANPTTSAPTPGTFGFYYAAGTMVILR